MAQPEEARDPSMEEILASIRKIIAEDGAEANTPPHLSVVSAREDDTDSDESPTDSDSGGVVSGLLEGESGADSDSDDGNVDHAGEKTLSEVLAGSLSPVRTPDNTPPVVDEEDRPTQPDSDSTDPELAELETIESAQTEDRLLSPQADHAVDQLASTILGDQARTLEDLVQDMMRPMLQHWLDDNLPVLVERLVREEIERVSRGRR